jgi:response regulator RpfG family c-di-GMP phosphodiesterase
MKPDPPPAPGDGSAPPAVTASVLIVDDSPKSLLALRATLEPLPVRVVEARAG